jgi:tetratricopeptide (TPR) repeat protein
MSEGKLPNFARLRREGAYGRLRSFEPMLSPILWTTIATGRTPDAHGIGHFVALDPKTGESLPVTSDMRKVRALWELLSERGRSSAVVGWWATWPPEPIRGAMVSDHLAYHFLFGDGLENNDPTTKTSPPELEAKLQPLRVLPASIGRAELAPFVDTALLSDAELAAPLALTDDLAHLRWVVATAETHRRIGLDLWRRERPDAALVYFEGTDSTAHLFGHLFRARGLAGELAAQQARYGRAVEAMYERADEILGDYLAAADGATTVLVLSDHGFRLGELPDDPSRLRDMARRVSERFHREDGVLFAWGRGVRAGARFEEATLLDVAPTALALLDLPASREMPGRVLTEGFARLEAPERVATFEAEPRSRVGGARDATTDKALVEHLSSLGYLGAARPEAGAPAPGASAVSSPQAERNLAALSFQERRYDDAERRYRALIAADPDDAGLRSSLAGVLGAQGRHDEATGELERALALDPLNPESYHNLGVLLERQGRPGEAVERYRTAVRYRPDFAPSRSALVRLTGGAEARAGAAPVDPRAVALCEEAAADAKRGDYAGALAKLEAARRLAPGEAMVHQYESNVAYLAGDTARAIAALERALALEPDNALYRHNLEQLRKR